jgi:hypothetical protein
MKNWWQIFWPNSRHKGVSTVKKLKKENLRSALVNIVTPVANMSWGSSKFETRFHAGKGVPYIHRHFTEKCCGSAMFIPDPGCEVFHPGSGSTSKNLSIFNPKKCFQALGKVILDVHPGSRIRIFILHPGSRIQKSKKHRIPDPDPQHRTK